MNKIAKELEQVWFRQAYKRTNPFTSSEELVRKIKALKKKRESVSDKIDRLLEDSVSALNSGNPHKAYEQMKKAQNLADTDSLFAQLTFAIREFIEDSKEF